MVFTTLSKKSPVGNSYSMDLDPKVARTLQQVAWDIHKKFEKLQVDSGL